MDTKVVLKSSTKTSLSDRFSKIQGRSQSQSLETPVRSRRSIGSLSSSNPLSIKRGVIGSRKPITDPSNRPRIGGIRGSLGSVASRLQKRPLRSNVQSFAADSGGPVRGGPSGRRGYQRGGRRGGTRGGATQKPVGQRVGNPAPRGFGKRGQSNAPAPKKEDLDKDLDSYMSKTKGFLDEQLDTYHKQK